MAEELFNPDGREDEAFRSFEDVIEAAACVPLARWLADNRPDAVAVEFDGSGADVWFVNVLTGGDGETTFVNVERDDDPQLWEHIEESWALLLSVSRAGRRVVSVDEAQHWNRE